MDFFNNLFMDFLKHQRINVMDFELEEQKLRFN